MGRVTAVGYRWHARRRHRVDRVALRGGGWPAVGLLGIGTFIVGTSELVIAGILPVVATDLGVSIAAAGYLVTAYALSFAVATPMVALGAGGRERKPMLVGCMAIFVVGNSVAVLAPSFAVLMLARVVSAAAAGVFEVVATAAAAALVPTHQRGRAIALIVSGFSVALLVGVPLGTLIGLGWGWRATFAALLVLGLVAVVGVQALMPVVPRTAAEHSWASPRQLLAQPDVLRSLGAMALAFTGVYIATTYLAPFLEEVSSLPPQAVAGVLLLLGLGSVLGNLIGGHASDHFGTRPTLLASAVVMALGLAALSLFGPFAVATIVSFAIFGIATGVFVPAQQARLVSLAHGAPEFALAVNLAALNVGISLGAAIGSAIVDRGGLAILGYCGAAVAVVAVGLVAGTTSRA
jgi:MFS transporter, DHA1 family, inner membrane transport protein